jgi:DNA-binding transcriptional regulator YiaG
MKRDGLSEEQLQLPDHDPAADPGSMLVEAVKQVRVAMRYEQYCQHCQMLDRHNRLAHSRSAELYEKVLLLMEELAAGPVQPASSEANAIKRETGDLRDAAEPEADQAEEHWPTLEETEAEDRAAGRIDEAKVAEYRRQMRDAQRAYKLAEIRRSLGLTQTEVAAAMHVSQRRVSAVERGELTRTNLGTVATYVNALGGEIEIVANFGDERIVIGLPFQVTC